MEGRGLKEQGREGDERRKIAGRVGGEGGGRRWGKVLIHNIPIFEIGRLLQCVRISQIELKIIHSVHSISKL